MLEVDQQTFFCGPLRVSIVTDDPELGAKIADSLTLYGVEWPPPHHAVRLEVSRSTAVWAGAAGSYLSCARMLVDAAPEGLRARSKSGAFADGYLDDEESRWRIGVPNESLAAPLLADIEDLVGLALTTGWRQCGYVPFHGAGVANGNRCAMICAHSGGGKSTLTAALVRRGWRTLGDDKLLLKVVDGRPTVSALVKTFNLHPQTRAWFPEVGDLELLQTYSAWTDKRRLAVETVWSEAMIGSAIPTHFVELDRSGVHAGICVSQLAPADILPRMLRHIVIPSDDRVARATLKIVAAAAAALRGLCITIGKHAYRDPNCLDALEAALR